MTEKTWTGRCYCGACFISAEGPVLTAAWCHCDACRRWTGAPAPAFAAFAEVAITGGRRVVHPSGAIRTNCPDCGSPLSATFDYLPGQTYVPVGVMDDAAALAPELHCHWGERLPWLHVSDDLPRHHASGRDKLNEAGNG